MYILSIFYSVLTSCTCSETKQRTLEELDQIFSVPVDVFARYQLTEWLPWFFKRYVLFQKGTALRPLYKIGDELE